jgi:hypothetical protein
LSLTHPVRFRAKGGGKRFNSSLVLSSRTRSLQPRFELGITTPGLGS